MKTGKRVGIVAAAAMMAAVIAGNGVSFARAAESTTMDYAVEIALGDAGLTEEEVEIGDVERGREQGASVYEVEFRTDSVEYEYDIAVADGEIVSTDWALTDPEPSGNQITQGRAKKIALSYAGVNENDASFSKSASGSDNGIAVYVFKFMDGTAEYKVTVAKDGGEILRYSRLVLNPACVGVAGKTTQEGKN